MKKEFRSSPVLLIINYLALIVLVAFVLLAVYRLVGTMLVIPQPFWIHFVFWGILVLPTCAYFSFFKLNVNVEVNDVDVVFRHGKRAYLVLPTAFNLFSALSETTTTRWLRAVDARGYEQEVCCYNFDVKTMDALITELQKFNLQKGNTLPELPEAEESR